MTKRNKQQRAKSKAHLKAQPPKRNARGHIQISHAQLPEAIVMLKRQMKNVPAYHDACMLGSLEMANSCFTLIEDYLSSNMPPAEFHAILQELITERMMP